MVKRRHRLELIVGLDLVGEPITGDVIDALGRRRAFSGWLDLMEVLDGARHGVDAQPGDQAPAQDADDVRARPADHHGGKE
jgi:hypothetical protein